MSRRTFVAAAALTPALATRAASGPTQQRSRRMPTAFVSHGAPTAALDAERGAARRRSGTRP